MRIVEVKCKGGYVSRETLLEYGKDRIPYERYYYVGTVKKIQAARMKNREEKGWQYLNLVCTFDIETTTIRETNEGFMYIWQFCLGDTVIIGRTWKEFFSFLEEVIDVYEINENKILVIYVHNLQFEFQFLKDFFEWKSVFATKKRTVLKADTRNGIEFRCSYKLTNMSLEKLTENSKNCEHIKQVGDIDYSIFRTSKTYITDEELAYCYCDVKGLAEAISDYMEEDTLATIPLTSTGFIRRECRIAMRKNPFNRKSFLDMRMDEKIYVMLKEALRGGNTHGSRFLSNMIIENVKNFDAISSYPYVQCCKYFPMSNFKSTPIRSEAFFEKEIVTRCCLFRMFVKKLEIKQGVPIPYISASKVTIVGEEGKKQKSTIDKFNGRVLYAENVLMTITELDYNIIKEQYDLTDMYIDDFYTAKRGKLPKEMRDYIKYRFEEKTHLKKGDPYYYMKSKNKLNGIFGMSCTDCVHDIYKLIHGEWEEKTESVKEGLEKFYNNSNSFLTYAWGIWTTAHGRAHLQRLINITGSDGTVYCDTDSDKCINPDMERINSLNEEIREEVEREEAFCDFDGKRYYMGVFEEEEPYKRFKTLGAKKYAYEDMNGKLHVTVSGVSKKNGAKDLGKLENFKPGFIFRHAGGQKVWYNDMKIHTLKIGDEEILTASNVGMADREYTIGLTGEYLEKVGINYLKLF